MELYHHSPNTPSWRDAQLKYSDNLFNRDNTTRFFHGFSIDGDGKGIVVPVV
jgi:hypothetical protein